VETRLSNEWRQMLTKISDDLNYWGRTFRKTVGAAPEPTTSDDLDDFYDHSEEAEGSDPHEGDYDKDLDRPEENTA
jgi:hypothetical protein